ncbi:response regulator [Pontibacter actiniarum]|uniref:DNA-binding response regulator n=1 Tax=Pontibacter actiniarum TaxID=323450 RepID=A0A1X9YRU8_9BACT|nr:response regulator transcription factor [Pontibacter actiniarum]ARS35597.1 DNA-binding response regulator [Pontibacter actiniarum]
MVRLILADDHKLIRDGVKALLDGQPDGVDIVGEAASGKELVEILGHAAADVVLLDINMPDMDGFEALRLVKQQHPDVKVLVLSMLDHERYVHQMMELGASGYVLKNAGKEELRLAIKLVANGTTYISSHVTLDLLRKASYTMQQDQPKERPHKELSKRELEVLNLISEGYTNADIAEKLFTSKRTIETHRQNLLEKTHTKNTAALIKYAVLNGIIN